MRKLCGKVMAKCFGEWGKKRDNGLETGEQKEAMDWKRGAKRLQWDENRVARGGKYRQAAGVGYA